MTSLGSSRTYSAKFRSVEFFRYTEMNFGSSFLEQKTKRYLVNLID